MELSHENYARNHSGPLFEGPPAEVEATWRHVVDSARGTTLTKLGGVWIVLAGFPGVDPVLRQFWLAILTQKEREALVHFGV